MEVHLKYPDDFIIKHSDEAVLSSKSPTFYIAYRVSKNKVEPEHEDLFWRLQYDLTLANKTNEPIKNLAFTIHFNEKMQLLLASSQWYNEPVDLNASSKRDLSHVVSYTWSPLILLKELKHIDPLTVEDFYNTMIEITWDTGREVIAFNQKAALDNINLEALEEEYGLLEPLDEKEVESINKAGKEY